MTKYHNPESCNKCGSMSNKNLSLRGPFDPDGSGEIKTECQECGFKDYWAHGFFESGQEMVSKAKTYSFD